MKLFALLATATALKQPLQKPLAVRGGGIDKAGVVKAVNIAWGFYAAQMILVPSKVHNDHFVRAPVEIKLQRPPSTRCCLRSRPFVNVTHWLLSHRRRRRRR